MDRGAGPNERRVIPAVTRGCRVPETFHATVHSVFRTVVNLFVEELDHLLTLIISDTMDLPQGIRLRASNEDAIRLFTPGQEMLCQEGVIRSAGSSFEIDLREARIYDGSIGTRSHGTPLGQNLIYSYQAAWDFLTESQAEKQADLRIADLSQVLRGEAADTQQRNRTIVRRLASLMENTRRLDLKQASAVMQSLVGLGGGLTPTGDDVLVGYLAGLRAASDGEAPTEEWIGRLCDGLRIASKGTNDISRTYLILAADGLFSSSLKNLVSAVIGGDPADKVREVAHIAFQVGHTSGLDAATGLLAGIAGWQDWLIPNSSHIENMIII